MNSSSYITYWWANTIFLFNEKDIANKSMYVTQLMAEYNWAIKSAYVWFADAWLIANESMYVTQLMAEYNWAIQFAYVWFVDA